MISVAAFQGSSISPSPSVNLHRSFKLGQQRFAVRLEGPNRISAGFGSYRAAAGSAGERSKEVMELAERVLVHTHARSRLVLVRGEGCKLYDVEGRAYLDFGARFALNLLGHGDPDLVKAVVEPGPSSLIHVSHVNDSIPVVKLRKRLVECSFAGEVFFLNSGTKANKAAVKFARKFQRFSSPDVKLPAMEFIAFNNSFHGRTTSSLASMSQENYGSPFEPDMHEVTFLEYGNIETVKNAIRPGKTAAVFVEPVRGVGGTYSAIKEFLQALRSACDDAGAILIFNEVQCGMGRSGYLWAHEAYGVLPDIMTLGEPLAGGLPFGAVLTTERVTAAISSVDHGSTFAAGPLICHAALVVLDKIQKPEFLASVSKKGEYLQKLLARKLGGNPHVKKVCGLGLLVGINLDVSASALVDSCQNSGILTAGKGNVVILAPPLVISDEELELATDILLECMPALDGNTSN